MNPTPPEPRTAAVEHDSLTEEFLDEWVRTGRIVETPPGGWTLPRLFAAVQAEARAAALAEARAAVEALPNHPGYDAAFVRKADVLDALSEKP